MNEYRRLMMILRDLSYETGYCAGRAEAGRWIDTEQQARIIEQRDKVAEQLAKKIDHLIEIAL